MKKFIQVEFDRNYTGGEYSGTGDFAYVPVTADDVEAEFEKQTGLPRLHIVHYSPDELYDADGEMVDDDDCDDGTNGQDRESYSDNQDRDSYSIDDETGNGPIIV